MDGFITDSQWEEARDALLDSGERCADLFRSGDPAARVTREWTVADTAAHLTAIALWDTALARPGNVPVPHPWNEVTAQLGITTVDTVDKLNGEVMKRFTERDPQMLARQLRAHIGDMLTSSAGLDPDRPVGWLGGSHIPLAAVFAHLTNELEIHGRDIALATGRRWTIPPEHAAQFLSLFVTGVTRHGVGQLLYKQGGTRRRIGVQFTSRYSEPVTLVLDDGGVTLADDDVPVDVRVRSDPATLNLMLFGRVSQARAVLSGKVRISGPRPWLLHAFHQTVRFPS